MTEKDNSEPGTDLAGTPGKLEAAESAASESDNLGPLSADEKTSIKRLMPNIFLGMTGCFFLACFIGSNMSSHYSSYYGDPWRMSLISVAPLYIYWAICIGRLAQIAALKFRSSSPISPFFVITLAFIQYFASPLLQSYYYSGYYSAAAQNTFPAILSNPSSWLWLAAQTTWPLVLTAFITKQTSPEKQVNWVAAMTVAVCSNLYLFICPTWNFHDFGFFLFWLFSQFGCIYFFTKNLGVKVAEQALPQKADASIVRDAGSDIVIPYRAFAGIERWRKQQQNALKKEMKVIVAVAIPVLIFFYFFAASIVVRDDVKAVIRLSLGQPVGSYMITALNQSEFAPLFRMILGSKMDPYGGDRNNALDTIVLQAMAGAPWKETFAGTMIQYKITESEVEAEAKRRNFDLTGPTPGPTNTLDRADQSISHYTPRSQPVDSSVDSANNLQFLGNLALLSSLAALAGIGFITAQPTHLGLNKQGWRLLWRRKFKHANGKYLHWDEIVRIYIDRPEGKTSVADARMCFTLRSGEEKRIKMGSIDSVEDRELILKAIQKWAPNVARDAAVLEALQPPADHSYTELWMQALSAPPKRERLKPLVPGTRLKEGRYQVLEQIGTGGQGQAYIAVKEGSNDSIVLKEFILPVFVDVNVRRSALEQFENEARILRQLDNPQIVKLIDFFVEDHRSYLVLEHITGKSLQDMVKKKGALAEQDVISLAIQMCDILSYLHGLHPPVIHRDFTPDNLILNLNNTLKLIDFNVAKKVVESTTSGTVVGKHAYLPPEQFRGMPECASDIYSMGGTLHFLLTGGDPEPIAVSHPKRIKAELSDGINAIVEKCTALDSKKRYQSPEELRRDLIKISSKIDAGQTDSADSDESTNSNERLAIREDALENA